MKLTVNAQTANLNDYAAPGEGRSPFRNVPGRLFRAFLLLAFFTTELMAAERLSFLQYQAQAQAPANHTPTSTWPVTHLLSVPSEPHGLRLTSLIREAIDWQAPLLPEELDSSNGPEDNSLLLFCKRLPSRYSYRSWAGFRTGFGQFFPNDYLGRGRTNGVGIQENDWLYLKVSFKF